MVAGNHGNMIIDKFHIVYVTYAAKL